MQVYASRVAARLFIFPEDSPVNVQLCGSEYLSKLVNTDTAMFKEHICRRGKTDALYMTRQCLRYSSNMRSIHQGRAAHGYVDFAAPSSETSFIRASTQQPLHGVFISFVTAVGNICGVSYSTVALVVAADGSR